MFFALPWMLLGLLGLPALAAIYWLRSRAKLQTVSSLFLWMDQRQPRQGGRIFQRLQTPFTFFLELLAILAIVMAAAGPAISRSRFVRPLILVLDDSYSMQAGGKASSRQRASEALAEELHQTEYAACVLLAGSRPRLLGGQVRSASELENLLQQWMCTAPTAALEPAIALAAEIGGPSARILVISDHAPSGDLPAGKVEWWSFGEALQNIALTAASRDASMGGERGQEDRTLLEVTNFGNAPVRAELVLEGAGFDAAARHTLEIAPRMASRLILNVATDAPELRATLGEDALAIDNQVVLVSPRRRPLRVQLSVAEANLRASLVRALEASGQVSLVESRADLIVSDQELVASENAWQLQILRGADGMSYEGPFVLDRSHPLTQGLSLDAVIWSAAERVLPVGTPVITAGNRVLMADSEDSFGRRKIQLALEPELSNLPENADWPILATNLIRWRLAALPGPAATNVRLGQTLGVTVNESDSRAGRGVVTLPGGIEQPLPIHGRRLEIHPDRVGLYRVEAGSMQFAFACSALNADESDLADCATGRWGSWNESEIFQDERVNLDWAFILVAMACLTTHALVVSRGGASGS